MDVTIILGDRALHKPAAVDSALAYARFDSQQCEVLNLEITETPDQETPNENPDFQVRNHRHRQHWKHAAAKISKSSARYVIIICSMYSETAAGPELSLPVDILRSIAETVYKLNGSLEIVTLIDDTFAIRPENHLDLRRALTIRQLEWTGAQYLASQLRGRYVPRISCFALQHPVSNLSKTIFRGSHKRVYLCYPINVFRREPQHPKRQELDNFRTMLVDSDLIVYDPLGIDEEVLISDRLGSRDPAKLEIHRNDRFQSPKRPTILATESELDAGGAIIVSPLPTDAISKQTKAQIPQRDFFWIESSDAVICWRPFLGGTHHAGVLAELQFAIHKNKTILAYSPEEDGDEPPSPFAAMVPTISQWDTFLEAIKKLTSQNAGRSKKTMESQKPPKYCDHTSVGVLIYNDKNELLLIERGTFPFGMAPVAGHVDQHQSYKEAAIAEAREEVGLEITDLQLLAEGRRENPCRRINGTWHYWKVYKAKASGTVQLSPREAKRAEWCDLQRLQDLGFAKENDPQKPSDSLEPVWAKWLSQLKVSSPDPTVD